jgi:hypothetical protein
MELRRRNGELIGTGNTLNEIIKNHKANLRGANLQETDLQETNLRGANLQETNLRGANLLGANLQETNLQETNLRGANLLGANLRGADLDFSCWPLWCGSNNVKIDKRQAKQLLAHAFNVAKDFWPDELTQNQKDWLNEFHRIQSNEFPKFE